MADEKFNIRTHYDIPGPSWYHAVGPLDSFPLIFLIVVDCVTVYVVAQVNTPGG